METVSIEIAYSRQAGQVDRLAVALPVGATVAQALKRCAWVLSGDVCVGVWGRPCSGDQPLRDHDRVELYRSLKVDPKEARRRRQHGRTGP